MRARHKIMPEKQRENMYLNKSLFEKTHTDLVYKDLFDLGLI